MTNSKSDSLPPDESWDTYWHGSLHGAAYTSGGISHPAILSFWDEFFKAAMKQYETPNIIDIGSGNGAVVECAKSAFGGQLPDFTCLDISTSAINILKDRFSGVHGVVADACSIPLDSAGFDIATSQFGIEYAGLEAIDEVARLVAPGGQLALLLHNKAGGIHKECAASLDAIERVQEAAFIPYSITMFEEGFAACRGTDRAKYEDAAKQLAPAIRTLESIITQYGEHVAGDTVIRLYEDVGRIHERIQYYEPTEVLGWLERMDGELQAFAGRMASMCNAAIDSATFGRLCERLRGQGYSTKQAEPLAVSDQELPLAWALIAVRH